MNDRRSENAWRTILCAVTLLFAGVAAAQKELTIEELESLIEQRKQQLEAAEANRARTREQVREVRRRLDEQRQRQNTLESELASLCRERERVTPGSFDGCMAEHVAK